jgi:hypothetical protein
MIGSEALHIQFNLVMSDIQVASAAFILMGWCYLQKKKKKYQKRWWQANLYRDRSVNGSRNLLNILKNQEISGQYKNVIRKSSTDFEYLFMVIGPKVAKEDTTFRRAISVTTYAMMQAGITAQLHCPELTCNVTF